MNSHTHVEALLAAVLKLAPKERLWLVERIVSSVMHDLDATVPEPPPVEEQREKSLNKLVNSLDTSEWEAMEVEDPFEWLKELRQKSTKQLRPGWDQE